MLTVPHAACRCKGAEREKEYRMSALDSIETPADRPMVATILGDAGLGKKIGRAHV